MQTHEQTEAGLIGAAIYYGDPVLTVAVQSGASPEWFETAKHRQAWALIVQRFGAGKPVTVESVCPPYAEAEVLDLVDRASVPSHIEYACHVLRAAYTLRTTRILLEQGLAAVDRSSGEDAAETISTIQGQLLSVSAGGKRSESLSQVAHKLIDHWENPQSREKPIWWPFSVMNRHMAPVTDDYIFVAARESVGKTALSLQWALGLAHGGTPVAYASLESSVERIVPRLIAQLGRVNTLALISGRGSTEDFAQARCAETRLADLPLRVTDRGMNTEQLRAWAMSEKAAGAKLLMVDNMKHIRASQRYGSTVEQFRDISARLKWIRDDLRLPLVVMHHLNKQEDVAWSDDINRDADVILKMTEDEDSSRPYDPKSPHPPPPTYVNIQVAKNRDGYRHMEFRVEYRKTIQTFEEGGEQ